MSPDDDVRSRDLVDVALRDEIELVSDLVVAASSTSRHFTPDEIDVLLGVQPGCLASPSSAEPRSDSPLH